MNTTGRSSDPPRFITHTTPLPCCECRTPTTTSRAEPRNDGGWTMIPLCAVHRPAEPDGESAET